MNYKFVPCTLTQGFFKSELYAIVGTSSVIVDRTDLQVAEEPNPDCEGYGLVKAVVIDARLSETLIELPGQPVVGGLRTWVPSSTLQEEPAVA